MAPEAALAGRAPRGRAHPRQPDETAAHRFLTSPAEVMMAAFRLVLSRLSQGCFCCQRRLLARVLSPEGSLGQDSGASDSGPRSG